MGTALCDCGKGVFGRVDGRRGMFGERTKYAGASGAGIQVVPNCPKFRVPALRHYGSYSSVEYQFIVVFGTVSRSYRTTLARKIHTAHPFRIVGYQYVVHPEHTKLSGTRVEVLPRLAKCWVPVSTRYQTLSECPEPVLSSFRTIPECSVGK